MRAHVSDATRTVICAVGLFLINFYVCRELFWTEYLNQMGSIEGSFIGLARYVMRNAPDLTWFPLWYNGIPYQNSYPPLFHWMVALWAGALHRTPAAGYHFIAAFFYCLGPVTLFLLCKALSGSRAYSFFAGLMHSVLSPSAFVIADVRHEIGLMRPRRLQALTAWGEGPHVAGLALLPLAVLALHRAVTRRRPADVVLCAISFAALAMMNWLTAVALFAAGVAYLCATTFRCWIPVVASAMFAYALVAPWILPSTVATIQTNAPLLGDFGGVYANMARNLGIMAILAAGAVAAVRRFTASQAVRFSAIFSFLMAALVLPAYWWKVSVVPQPVRYQLELELGLTMLVIFGIKPLVDRIPGRWRAGMAITAAILAVIPAKSDRRFARYLISPVKIGQTIEYKTAAWLDRNVPGQRVFASGSTQFWLNAFTDTPEVTGGFDNGVVNQVTRTASYIVRSAEPMDRDGRISILWLKAMGAQAVVVGGADTTQAYRDDRNPGKFDGALERLWHEGGDSIYRVPQRSASLARVMTRADLADRTPANGIDIEPLVPYVKALDDASFPPADFRWVTRHSASIHANTSATQVVSVLITYHPGWHARANDVETPVMRDGLGQMYLEPGCNGECSIELNYDGGVEMSIARGVAAMAWSAVLGVFAISFRNRAGVGRQR